MTEDAELEIDDHPFTPPEGDQAGDVGGPEVSGPVAMPAMPGWTPQEAAQLAGSIITTGLLVGYIARHQRAPGFDEWQRLVVQAQELPGTGMFAAPWLDRYMPKSAGGGALSIGLGLLAVAGEVGGTVARRADLLQKQERPRVLQGGLKDKPQPGPAPAEAPAPPPPPEAPTSSTFRFSREQAAVLQQQRPGHGLEGLGY